MPVMVLARKFTQSEDNNYEGLVAAAGRLRAILDAFAQESLPPEYDVSIVVEYTKSLLATQRPDGSFSTSLTPDSLDPETSADAHRFVTWISAALLNLLLQSYPDEASEIPSLKDSISRALNSPVALSFQFPESGPAEIVQQVEAVLILTSGRIPLYLKTNPSIAPQVASGIAILVDYFHHRLTEGDTVLPGGIEYKDLFTQATATLT